MWLICVVPMMLGVSLKSFTAYTVMTQRICGMIILAAAFRFPAKFRKQWEKSFLHVPDPIFYALLVFITMIEVSTLAMSIITISLPVFLGNVILVSGLAIYACYRYKAGKTYVNIAMEDDDSVIQPTHSFMEDLK